MMLRFPYYPGCTLKQWARSFEISALAAASHLGIELVEIPRWNCCGVVFSLTSDNAMRQVGPIRNLIRVQQMNDAGVSEEWRLVTLCSMCFNVLKRANLLVRSDPTALKLVNSFMDTEPDYRGEVQVVHFLEVLRDILGFEEVSRHVARPLEDLRVSAYYGCMLLRPREVGIDDPEAPKVMDDLIAALGAEPVESPYRSLCCGSYHTVGKNKEIVAQRIYKILQGARERGADLVITSCPLCAYNLRQRQELARSLHPDFRPTPVLYFTQLLALAFGLGDKAELAGDAVDLQPLLLGKKQG
jgi:heterodisulfide reductase subunit B